MRVPVDEEQDPVAAPGVTSVNSTTVEGVPSILDGHEAETVCGMRGGWVIC